jgi:N-acetylglucosaminyl-diphospho-decaprenol L-rhamnosyltransferase
MGASAVTTSEENRMLRPVAVVCVTYNAVTHLAAMLDSLRDPTAERYHVIVVDNGSSDGTLELLRRSHDVQLIEQANTGYADGVNRGVAAAPGGHDVLVLNADIVVEPGAIEHLAALLRDRHDVAIAVPSLRDPDGRLQPSLRHTPTWWRTAIETVVGGTRAGRFGESYRPDPGMAEQEADWATGAAMLIRREVLDEVGPWDATFFLYSEETEFCLRVRDAGYRVVCVPRAVMTHEGGDMATRPELWALRAVNRVRLQRRRSRLSAAALRAASVLFELRRAALGDAVSRAALRALLSRDLDAVAMRLVHELGGEVVRSP